MVCMRGEGRGGGVSGLAQGRLSNPGRLASGLATLQKNDEKKRKKQRPATDIRLGASTGMVLKRRRDQLRFNFF